MTTNENLNGSDKLEHASKNSLLSAVEIEEIIVSSSPQEEEPMPSTYQMPIDWKLLPPLPTPTDRKQKEFQRGAATIGGSAFICIVLVHGSFSLWSGEIQRNSDTWLAFIVAVYAVATLELLFLFAMYYVDPGVVKRSSLTCYPIPAQVQPYIRSYIQQQQEQHQSEQTEYPLETHLVPPFAELYIQSGEANERGGETGELYCVRCLIWRRGKRKYFHCTTCQQCVDNYDHHCGVFGRCIAGRLPCQGNLPFFYLIILTGGLLYWITVIALAWMFGSGSF